MSMSATIGWEENPQYHNTQNFHNTLVGCHMCVCVKSNHEELLDFSDHPDLNMYTFSNIQQYPMTLPSVTVCYNIALARQTLNTEVKAAKHRLTCGLFWAGVRGQLRR